LNRLGGCDTEREISFPCEDINFKLAESHSQKLPKDFLPYEEKENNKDNEIMYEFNNNNREENDKNLYKNDELASVRIGRMDSPGHSSVAIKSNEEFYANAIPDFKKAAGSMVQRNTYNEFKLSSYNPDQEVEGNLNPLKSVSINDIVEGEENCDEYFMEKSKSSYLESGEKRVKLASSRIAYISHGFQV